MRYALLTGVIAMLCTTLLACGGGGGSGSDGGPADPRDISFTLSRSSVNVTAVEESLTYPTENVTVTLSTVPDDGLYIFADGTDTGLLGTQVSDGAGNTVTVNLQYRPSEFQNPGVYDDPVVVRVCLDEACTQPLSGSPQTIASRYTVTALPILDATESRLSGFRVKIAASDFAWDPASERFLLTTRNEALKFPDSVAVLDPATGVFSQGLQLTYQPSKMAVSANGEYVYVEDDFDTHTDRFALPDFTEGVRIDPQPGEFALHAGEFAPSPVTPTTYAVALENGGTPFRMRVIDGQTARPNDARAPQIPDHVCWNTATELWGSGVGFFRYDVDAAGVTRTLFASYPATTGDVLCGAVLAHTTTGFALDPATGAIARYYGSTGDRALSALVDGEHNRYYLLAVSAAGQTELRAFDAATGAALGTVRLLNFNTSFALRMLRWGPDGVAILGANQIFVLHGVFVSG